MTVIWCMVPEIWSMTDRLGPFLPFYTPNNPKNQNFEKIKKTPWVIILNMCTINGSHMMYGSWDTECDRPSFLLFWTIFCPFTPLKTQKTKILKKWKKTKTPRHITILHKCAINDNHMMYCSWDMKHDGQNFLSFWTVSCPFITPLLTTQKNKILKNWKKHLDTSSFYTSVPQIMIIYYILP